MLVLCHDIKHPDLASPTEYSHRERITCHICAMACHTTTLPLLLSTATVRVLRASSVPFHDTPRICCPTEYSHRERITCQFCAVECHTPTLPFLLSTATVIDLTASSVSWRATPRPVMFLRTKRRVVVGYGLSEEFPVNIG